MSISLTTTGTTGPSTYNSTTGVLNIPNYSDISKLGLTTSSGGGPATYASGALHIPIYAPRTVNQALFSTPTSRVTNSSSPVSTGYGVSFTAAYNASVLVSCYCFMNTSLSNYLCGIYVYRTTGTIPASGAAITGGDVQVASSSSYALVGGGGFSTIVIIYDTTLTVGIPYNYYFAFAGFGGGLTLGASSLLQLTEAK